MIVAEQLFPPDTELGLLPERSPLLGRRLRSVPPALGGGP